MGGICKVISSIFLCVHLPGAHRHRPGGEPVWAHSVPLCRPEADTVHGPHLSKGTSKDRPPYVLLMRKKKVSATPPAYEGKS